MRPSLHLEDAALSNPQDYIRIPRDLKRKDVTCVMRMRLSRADSGLQ